MKIKFLISEKNSDRVIESTYFDAEIRPKRFQGSAPVQFVFTNELFLGKDNFKKVFIKLTNFREIPQSQYTIYRQQEGHIYAIVDTLEPIINPPTFLETEKLREIFSLGSRRERMIIISQIREIAQEENLQRIQDVCSFALSKETLPDTTIAELIKAYQNLVKY